jgi:hypothetical protein
MAGLIIGVVGISSSLLDKRISQLFANWCFYGLFAGATGALAASIIRLPDYTANYHSAEATCYAAGLYLRMTDLPPRLMLVFTTVAGAVIGTFIGACITTDPCADYSPTPPQNSCN